jgi:hypothetical protein
MKKFTCVLFITLALPVFGALENRNGSRRSPFVAAAGRSTAGGGACSCGDANCITEPGECGGNLNSATPGDAGAVVLIVAVAFAFWLRLRS